MRDTTTFQGDINPYDEDISRRADAQVAVNQRSRKLEQWSSVLQTIDDIDTGAMDAHFDGEYTDHLDKIRALAQSLRRQIYSRLSI